MLASKTPFPAPLLSTSNMSSSSQSSAMQSSRRAPATMTLNQSFASPTESEFSDVEGPESAKNWSEERVCDWLRTINCGEYEKLFKKNNINGENLLEMDKAVLQEMGIEKIGDRVRLFLGIKKLRTKAYANQKKRNRVSIGLCHLSPLHESNSSRIPLLASMPTHHHRPVPHDLQTLETAEPCPHRPPIRDTLDNSKASIQLLQSQKISPNHPRGLTLPSPEMKFEL